MISVILLKARRGRICKRDFGVGGVERAKEDNIKTGPAAIVLSVPGRGGLVEVPIYVVRNFRHLEISCFACN